MADAETDKTEELVANREKEKAANTKLAASAWDQATRGITGADQVIAALKPRFVEAIVEGRAMPDVEDDISDQLAVADWTWPWFEESYKMFGEWRMWPNTWPQLRPADDGTDYSDDDLAEYRKAAIAPLIISSAAMIFFRDRHVSKAHPHQKWRLVHSGDAASMRASEPHTQKIKDGDLSTMPPFYPGDKTRIGADNPLKADEDQRPAAPAGPGLGVKASAAPAAEEASAKTAAPAKKAAKKASKKTTKKDS